MLAGLLGWMALGWVDRSRANAAAEEGLDWQIPNPQLRLPFAKETPIYFVGTQQPAEWNKLPTFWNPSLETVVDPSTGTRVTRAIVKIKLPLGLSQAPKVPLENPLTVQRWELGRRLYFDTALSSDGTVSCANCHDPRRGFTDQSPVSTGINGLKGGVSAPTVLNSAYNFHQFWDGRAASLEDQCQGPPQNPVEMFDGKGNAWHAVVRRIRNKGDYSKRFLAAFGTEPTRDAIAMAIASYERTVLTGNSLHDRADRVMRLRVAEEESTDFTLKAKDYETGLKDAFSKKDEVALKALGLDAAKDQGKVAEMAETLSLGQKLFFGKARCSLCHVGENFSDGQFHNLGVGVKDGKVPKDALGRFASLPTGHKNPELVGAFKTPPLRSLVTTGPYMHDGSEATLEKVIDFYDRGGNANEFLDVKMRDPAAEQLHVKARLSGKPYEGPKVEVHWYGSKPMVPAKLNLTTAEKAALVRFLQALQGEVHPLVTDPSLAPPSS